MNDDDIGFWQGLLFAVAVGAGFYLSVIFLFSF
jgi:hypothetical protein